MSNKPSCSVEGCGAAVWARGLCNRHYLRWRNAGGKTNPRGRPWTAEEDATILAARPMANKGRRVKRGEPKPVSELDVVAAKLERSIWAVRSRRSRLIRGKR